MTTLNNLQPTSSEGSCLQGCDNHPQNKQKKQKDYHPSARQLHAHRTNWHLPHQKVRPFESLMNPHTALIHT